MKSIQIECEEWRARHASRSRASGIVAGSVLVVSEATRSTVLTAYTIDCV
jgi:hypothetical protein